VPRSSKTKTRRKRLRRLRNRRRREALLRTEPEQVRVRTSFSGKARSGDEATVDLEFSDVSVPFDPESEEFAQETGRRHAAAEAWHDAGHPTSGEG
jgi:hypothetical protein